MLHLWLDVRVIDAIGHGTAIDFVAESLNNNAPFNKYSSANPDNLELVERGWEDKD
ncbi:hypothetical protein Pla22_47790 [Rubripirellula amarantea]|uniref:Uncharacterized protein n=1 Tax=Rubripirellula amarantea TaxID=2527999 RepID=A0A5C5WIF0_9BACT|nr:hypothetical protein [Rubripirellula amarantea]TWT49582.1 hypothetical protein Pla22_47790 [Rubripirellula amarantea]